MESPTAAERHGVSGEAVVFSPGSPCLLSERLPHGLRPVGGAVAMRAMPVRRGVSRGKGLWTGVGWEGEEPQRSKSVFFPILFPIVFFSIMFQPFFNSFSNVFPSIFQSMFQRFSMFFNTFSRHFSNCPNSVSGGSRIREEHLFEASGGRQVADQASLYVTQCLIERSVPVQGSRNHDSWFLFRLARNAFRTETKNRALEPRRSSSVPPMESVM